MIPLLVFSSRWGALEHDIEEALLDIWCVDTDLHLAKYMLLGCQSGIWWVIECELWLLWRVMVLILTLALFLTLTLTVLIASGYCFQVTVKGVTSSFDQIDWLCFEERGFPFVLIVVLEYLASLDGWK